MRGIPFNIGWKFFLGEPEAPHLTTTNDADWRTVSLPHDWSVELSFDQEKGEACTGYLPGGIAWYRKHFVTDENMAGKKIYLHFDGIYNRASVYCNGKLLRFHPYGYSPFVVDITDFLNPVHEDNVIAVKVDHSRYADSRWYTGSGIYRKVSMHILPKLHIPVWGTFYSTPVVRDDHAIVKGQITVTNASDQDQNFDLIGKIFDPHGNQVASQSITYRIGSNEHDEICMEFTVPYPKRWDIHQPNMYRAEVDIIVGGEVIQREKTSFGIRDFYFDKDKGFFLNGRRTLIKGVCLHHDAGLVGAAVPGDVWRRRLELLKDMGCNAIRTAHNPVSEDFLDLCDEMGFLVQEEFFDEWDNPKDKRKNGEEKFVDYITRGHAEFFREYAKEDLQNTVRRDRNHPCIIQWSIGNEIEWTYPKYNEATGYFGMNASGNYFWTLPPNSKEQIRENIRKIPEDAYDIGKTAKKLADWTRELDTTRPVTANCILPSASYESGYIDALDMVGYSYRRVIYDYGHEHYPDKPIMGTENVGQWHEWKAVLEREFVAGTFIWTGIDHLGEASVQKPWPRKSSNVGLIDLAGFPKPAFHMFKSLWSDEPHIHMVTQQLEKSLYELRDGDLQEKEEGAWQRRLWFWHDVNHHWNYRAGEQIVVEVYSNCDEVSLYLNDSLVGTRYLHEFEDRIYKWLVPFQPGELKAVGKKDGKTVQTAIYTVGSIHGIALQTDKDSVKADLDSVVHVTAQFVDEQGFAITNQEERIDFEVDGPCRILGVDNGSPDSVEDYQKNHVTTHLGRCLMILQGTAPGTITIRARNIRTNVVSNECQVKVIPSSVDLCP
ncbi:glycosyl hydrolase family 2, sugar binding domain protein [Paenibacillus sp. oral taxon 786 str. D14]|uniref:glycoside hydrolase family 2 TIM barrel-domain containing protein n=1 Tax=Paenibacillus sp. oral taxon 786 TaxID=652715 RepID=UPI0001AFDCFE|nr:glycoside hydrolase family 2 TIM barrel-domain containing protein [Paenibacillus sp. oral taxon 786]EES72366.1 glycosyl hydrolase family 2, sugar binding domain protein [Paenibacillus sp. oral taxon 786 str. D14]